MKRLLGWAAALALPLSVAACSCPDSVDVWRALGAKDVVFEARVFGPELATVRGETRRVLSHTGLGHVRRVWQGTVPEIIRVRQGEDPTCLALVQDGDRVVLSGSQGDEEFELSRCSPFLHEVQMVEAELGRGKPRNPRSFEPMVRQPVLVRAPR